MATIDLTVALLLMPQLRRLRDEGYEVTAISAPGSAVAAIEAEGIRHIPWPEATRAWDPGADARAFASLLRILRRERFDVVHTHNPKPGFVGRIAARAAGVPCVVNTVHGLYTTPDDGAARKSAVLSLEWIAARFSDLELYQSEEDLGWARRIGLVDPPRAALLGNGIDVRRFDPDAVPPARLEELRAELGIPRGAPVVGTVGRLVVEKGYRELVAAARTVREEFPDVRFLAIGPRDVRKWDALGAGDLDDAALLFTGWRDDVPELLALMDVFVLASWREGLPRSAIEAASMARPLVLTDIRGCREVVRDGEEGLLVPRRDAARLADAILRLLRDPPLREKMGAAARTRALEHFDERRVADTLAREYRKLLERTGMVGTDVDIEGLGRITIRPARPGEAGLLARFHRATHPGAFLPVLGERFLEHLYRGLIEDPDAVAVVAERDGTIAGYATGVMSMSAFYRRFFLRHGVAAGMAIAPRLLRPGVLQKITETARYPEEAGALGMPEAEFSSLAVDQRLRSKHLGGLLSTAIIEALSRRGADEIRGTVNQINAPMNRMMQRIGFEHVGEITLHDGSLSNLYVIRTRPDGGKVEIEGVDGARVRRARAADAPALARLHGQSISRGFLPRLGRGFLELLYRALIDDRDGSVVVLEQDGSVVAFAAGTLSTPRFYRRFALRYGPRALAIVGPRLLRGRLLRGVVETARYPVAAGGGPEAEWLVVAMEPSVRSHRVGELLGREVVSDLCRRGAGAVRITVAAENQRVRRLLDRMGFSRRRRITVHPRHPSEVWVIACRSS